MRKGFLGALVLVLAASSARAQLPFHRPPPGCENGPDYHCWTRFDHLLWWLKDAPLPVPLASTGAIGAPDTVVLFGGGTQNTGVFNGGRVVSGFWVDCEGILGFEGGAFVTERRSGGFSFNSDADGNPGVGVPFQDATDGTEFTIPTSVPGSRTGSLNINNSMRLWGYNGDSLVTIVRSEYCEMQLLSGFRYVDLLENFDLANSSTLIGGGGTTLQRDHFQTRNQFYGGEVGLRARINGVAAFIEMTGKIAFGVNHQKVDIAGQTTTEAGGVSTVTTGGIFAQSSNIGLHERTEFAIVPEAQIRVGAALSSHLKVSIGYDFVYMSEAVRPGDQIDRVVNFSPGLGGPARPAFNFTASDFYAHGLSLGLELRY